MDQSEVEKLIGELETALDRLRALYEQYFMGIERIEPGVVRKDVDRRFYVLRKEQIRNTALRYRFQMLLQKYNTYQTHWQRVCREIENGTYKRHLMRAQRRFGSSRPPRRRSSVAPEELLPEPGASLPQALASQLAELDRDFAPASVDIEIPLDDTPSSRPPSRLSPPPPIAPATPVAGAHPSSALGAPTAPRPISPGGAPAWRKVGPGAPVPAPPQGTAPQRPPVMPHQGASPPAPVVHPPPGMPPGSAPARPVAPRPPLSGGSPAAPPAARPAPHAAPLPSKPAAQPPPPRPETPQPVSRPAQPAPGAPPHRPQPPRPTPSAPPPNIPSLPRPQPSPAAGELSEKRLRQIYVEYLDTKRRQNESTAALSFVAVAKSLRESGDRLRQKHGKEVDFEVAVKDGKTILRPVLK